MIEKYVHIDNGTVVYWISDNWKYEKKTLFFFHGITGDHSMFQNQYAFFCDDYNLIAWDAPGHGKSRPFKDFTMDIAAKIIMKIVYQENIQNFIAIGQSFGGYFPQAFMCRSSDVIEGVIGIGTSPYGKNYYSRTDFFWLRQVGWFCMCCPWKLLKKISAKSATVTKDGYENMMEMLCIYSKKEYAKIMREYYTALMYDNQDVEINCPVLLIRGKNDNIGKVKVYCDMWHEKEGFTLKIIKDAGHNANVDNPKEVNSIISNFIKSII